MSNPIRALGAAAAVLVLLGLSACNRPGEVQPPAGGGGATPSTAPSPTPSPTTPTDSTPSSPMPPASAASQ